MTLKLCQKSQPLLKDKILKKTKGTWNSDKSLFRLQNKFRKIPLLVIYCLSLMMQYETEMPQDISPPAGTLQAC